MEDTLSSDGDDFTTGLESETKRETLNDDTSMPALDDKSRVEKMFV